MVERSLLISFSGQGDSVAQCDAVASTMPDRNAHLLYVHGIGIRPHSDPPLEVATRLHASWRRARQLVIAKGTVAQYEFLSAIPLNFVNRLGVRTSCAACQVGLRVVRILVAIALQADIVLSPSEALGADLDAVVGTVDAVTRGYGISTVSCHPSASAAPKILDPAQGRGGACALSRFHRDIELLPETAVDEFTAWAASWTRAYIDKHAAKNTRALISGGLLERVVDLETN